VEERISIADPSTDDIREPEVFPGAMGTFDLTYA